MPVISMISDSGATSTTRARKTSRELHHVRRAFAWSARDLDQRQVARDRRRVGDVLDAQHVDQLVEVRLDAARAVVVGCRTTIVMRETPGFSVWPTVSDSMLKPRRRNSDATRFSTPGLSST